MIDSQFVSFLTQYVDNEIMKTINEGVCITRISRQWKWKQENEFVNEHGYTSLGPI